MTIENSLLDSPIEAEEDLSDDQYRFIVKDATSGKARRPNAANERATGVLQNAPKAGETAVIMTEGLSKVQAAGVLAINAMVTPEYVSAADAGKALSTSTPGDYVRGIVVEPADAEDELATIRLVDFYYATS